MMTFFRGRNCFGGFLRKNTHAQLWLCLHNERTHRSTGPCVSSRPDRWSQTILLWFRARGKLIDDWLSVMHICQTKLSSRRQDLQALLSPLPHASTQRLSKASATNQRNFRCPPLPGSVHLFPSPEFRDSRSNSRGSRHILEKPVKK